MNISKSLPIQAIVNEANKKLYIYELENGNRVSSFEPLPGKQKIAGSKINKLIQIIQPEKSNNGKTA